MIKFFYYQLVNKLNFIICLSNNKLLDLMINWLKLIFTNYDLIDLRLLTAC